MILILGIIYVLVAFVPTDNVPRWFDFMGLCTGVILCMQWAYSKGKSAAEIGKTL